MSAAHEIAWRRRGGVERDADRELVRGREQSGVGAGELVDDRTVIVDRDVQQLQAFRLDDASVELVPVGLERHCGARRAA